MNIYLLKADANRYQGILPCSDEDWDVFSKFDGNPIKNFWSSIEICFYIEDIDSMPRGDFPILATHVPVFSRHAVNCLKNTLESNGELLPLKAGTEIYYAYNVTTLLNALNPIESTIIRFSTGELMDIEKYSFFAEQIINTDIFKIPQASTMDVFVTDGFVEKVKDYQLTGFIFKLVWTG